MISITVRNDTITAALKGLGGLASVKKPQLMRAMGLAVVSVAQRSFNEPALRQAAWPAKRDGTASNLKRRGTLRSSLRITSSTSSTVTVGSDRKYAPIHQFGGVIVPKAKKALKFKIGGQWVTRKRVVIPARPFFPITPAGQLTPPAVQAVESAITGAINAALKGDGPAAT